MFQGIGSQLDSEPLHGKPRTLSQEHHEHVNLSPQYEESRSTQHAADDDDHFYLTLSIHYETKFGEYLCVTGDVEELGNW